MKLKKALGGIVVTMLFFSRLFAQPTISSVSPNIANPGTSITITGTNFNTTAANNIVYFGATKATVSSASATSLTVTSPVGATYDRVSVLNTALNLAGYEQYAYLPKYDNSAYMAGLINFNGKIDFHTVSLPYSVAIGDLDGDGKADLAVISYGSATVSVYRNTSSSGSITSGSFAAKVDFTTGAGPQSVAIGDLDGDGKADMAVVNRYSNTLSIYRNTSTSGSITSGSFATKVDFTTGTPPQSVAIGDLDGDGKADVVVVNTNISVYRNTSSSGSITSGSFAAKVDFTTGTDPCGVAIGDLDGDGKADLAVPDQNSNTVSVYRNTSSSGSITSGSFAAKVNFTTGSGPCGVAIGDLDGDGKADLAVANQSSNTVSVYRNTSSSGSITSGSFAAKVDFATGTNPFSIAVGDLNGDGKADLAIANSGSATVSVLLNTASSGSMTSSSFAAKADLTTGPTPVSVVVGDLDGDGKADLAIANYGNDSISIIRNNPVIQPPVVTTVSPNIANPGSTITITGNHFNTTAANNIVYFGATKATVSAASATSLTVTSPVGATYDRVSVLNTASNLAGNEQYAYLPKYDNSAYIAGLINCDDKVDFTTGSSPQSIAIGDLDGDGKADLAVANYGSNTVSVYRNTSSSGSITSGSFAAKVDFTTGTNPISIAIGDLDGDGKPDLAVANYSSNTASVFQNTSSSGSITTGSFAAKVDFTTGTSPYSVAVGDLDGDGKAELGVANSGSNTVSIFRNTSSSGSITTASFAAKIDFTTGTSPVSLALGDIDGDGKADIAVANNTNTTVSVFRNTSSTGSISTGSFAAKVDFTTGTQPYKVAIGDLDGDGKADLAVGNFSSNTVSVFRNTSSSGSITASSFATKVDFTTGTNPQSLAIGDMDGDGKADLAVTNYSSTSVSIFRNTTSSGSITSGSFAAKVDLTAASAPYGIAIGDLDGDGKADLAFTNFGSTSVSIIRNNPVIQPPTITAVSPNIANPGTSITITGTNFNTTATNNIVYFGATKATVSSASATSLTVTSPVGATYDRVSVLNTGLDLAGYEQYSYLPKYDNSAYIAGITNCDGKVDFTTGTNPNSIAIGDLDGDGKVDLAVTNAGSGTVSVYRNMSSSGTITSGSFAAKVDFNTGSIPYSVAIGDLDGDGKPDLAVANFSSSTVSVFRNTVNSGITATSFAAKVDFTTGTFPASVAIGDLDSDGKADLAVANNNSNSVSIFHNTASSGSISASSFAAKVDFTTGTNPYSVAIGDLDGDGKADLAVVNYYVSTISILRNTTASGSITSGSFAAKVDFATGSAPRSVAIGDLDGDGKADLAVANESSTSVSVFRNTASTGSITTGSFAAKVDFTTGSRPRSVAIGDIDGDGKPDLATANNSSVSPSLSVFRNTATSGSITTSSFAAKLDFATGNNSYGVAFGDLDGDGKADLATANNGSNSVSVIRNNPLNPISGAGAVCIGSTRTLANATSGGTWSSSATAIATVSTAGVVTGAAAGSAIITYAVPGGNDTALITVNALPTITAISSSTNTICTGTALTFTAGSAAGTGTITSYNWSGPNSYSTTSTATTAVLTPTTTAAGGVYSLTVTYPGTGCTSAAAVTSPSVTVNAKPTIASITPSSTTICTGIALTFTAGSKTGTGTFTSYNWTGPNSYSTTSTATTAVLTPTTTAAGGVYSLTVTYPGTGCTSTAAVTSPSVTVNAKPTIASITPSSTTICTGTALTFTAGSKTGTGTFTSYNWTGPNSYSTTSTATTAVLTPTTTAAGGVYSLTVTYPGTGCTSAAAVTSPSVTVNAKPTIASITPSSTTICTGAALTLTAGSKTGTGTFTSYNWTGPNSYSITSTATTAVLTPTATAAGGVYSLTVTYPGTGCTSTAAVTSPSVTVNAKPTIASITPSSTTICTGAALTLTAGSKTGTGTFTSYNWTGPNSYSITSTATTAVLTPTTTASSGVYSLTVTYPGTGCTSTGAVTSPSVTVNPSPTVTATAISSTICNGSSTSITASGANTYSWAPATGLSATTGTAVTSNTSATRTYTITGTSAAGCTGIATKTITVLTTPTASITSAPMTCVGYSSNIIFSGTTADTIRYTIDGGSYSNAVLTGGTYTLSTGAISAAHTYLLHDVRNAACSVVIDTSAIINPSQMTWTGATSTDWQTASNWSCGTVPVLTDNIIIPPGTTYQPLIGTSSFVKDITMNTSSSLTINSTGILNVKGTLTNNGNVTGTGALIMNGTSAQAISGTGNLSNFELNNSAGASISAAARVTINSTLYITSGTLTTNDSLVLNSDVTATARIATLPASGAGITGNVKVMQYIPGGMRRFRFLSHPFSSYIPLSQLENYIDVTGPGDTTQGFTRTASNAPSAFRYDPLVGNSSLPYDIGWRPFTSAYGIADSNRFHQHQGIRIMVRGSKGEGLGYGSYTPSAVTVAMWGPVNQGNQTIFLQKGTSANQEYNMVGNPYPSPVDIGTVLFNAKASGNITGSVFYVWNPNLGAAGQFQAIFINTVAAAPYYLQSNCSFQVRAAHNGDSLNFTENHKSATATASLLKVQPDHISLMVYDMDYHPWDMLYVKFNDGATDAEDKEYDATKPSGADFNFYSISADSQKLVVDARPYYAGNTIPLGINSGYEKDFIIKAEGMTVPGGGKVYLHDRLLKQYVLLAQGTEYKFSITADKATQGENRFELSMEPAAVIAPKTQTGLTATLTPNPATTDLNVVFTSGNKEEVTIKIIDLSGVCVYNKNLGVQQVGEEKVSLSNFASGIYMVELTSGSKKVVQRLIKRR